MPGQTDSPLRRHRRGLRAWTRPGLTTGERPGKYRREVQGVYRSSRVPPANLEQHEARIREHMERVERECPAKGY